MMKSARSWDNFLALEAEVGEVTRNATW
jgi:hypothetical protein